MSEEGRRFTDREVALVLKRATELDDAASTPSGHRGTSIAELRSIASEVGISEAAINRAVAGLDAGQGEGVRLFGPSGIRKAVHAIPVELDEDGVSRLVRVVDHSVAHNGTVTEALGSVRWMGSTRFTSTQVSITPGDGETAIEVVEKAEPAHRYIFQLLPAAWGAMFSIQPIVVFGWPGLLVGAGAALAGWGLGRTFWGYLERLGQRRVKKLAAELAEEGRSLTP